MHSNLAVLLAAGERYPDAERAYHQAVAVRCRLATDFPTQPEYR
jgi:hypothetical protein